MSYFLPAAPIKLLRLFAVTLFCLLSSGPVYAAESKAHSQLVGEGRLRYLFWDIYDVSLYSQSGKWQAGSSFTLKIQYLRNAKGKLIAEKSLQEMQKQGLKDKAKSADWLLQMEAIFPNVKKGSVLTGVVDGNRFTTFYYQNEKIGEINNPDFSQRFFDIWLGENTSNPKLRKQLLGI